MDMKEESEKVGLKLNIQKTKITLSDPIISWQIVGKTMEIVRDCLIFLTDTVHLFRLNPWLVELDSGMN